MKKICLLVALLLAYGLSSQELQELKGQYIALEKKAFFNKQIKANVATEKYDVLSQKLLLFVNPNQVGTNISGTVISELKITEATSTLFFDLHQQLTVSEVKINGVVASYSQADDMLQIQLLSQLMPNEIVTTTVVYSGNAYTGNGAFVRSTHSGTPIIWTLSEPFGAKDWWPCKQDLSDKIDNLEVQITAPSNFVSVANGVQIAQSTNNGLTTTTYKHQYPIPAYLVAIAVTNYTIDTLYAGLGTPENPTVPIVNYLYPESRVVALNSIQATIPMFNLFQEKIGRYPFYTEKYGHAQFGWGGGMEHSTVSFMGAFPSSLIAHELAHQWFGNQVTCGSWKDIWLNEGLTEYMAGIVVENTNGATAFKNWKQGKISSITSFSDGNLYLTDAQAIDVNRIFDYRITYNKGAMVTHMLRQQLGDAAFFKALKAYLNHPTTSYGYATTAQFKSIIEADSGQDLTTFFNNWVYGEGFPSFAITGENLPNQKIRLQINQTTSHTSVSFFETKLPITFLGDNNERFETIINCNTNNFDIDIPVPFVVKNFMINEDFDIISKNNTAKLSNPDFEENSNIVVYPNPFLENIYIQLPYEMVFYSCQIIDGLGKIVIKSTQKTIDTVSLSKGVYLLKINTDSGVIYKKIIKK